MHVDAEMVEDRWSVAGLPTPRARHQPAPRSRRLDDVAAAKAVHPVVLRVERVRDAPACAMCRAARAPGRRQRIVLRSFGGGMRRPLGKQCPHRHDVANRFGRLCSGRLRRRRWGGPGWKAVLPPDCRSMYRCRSRSFVAMPLRLKVVCLKCTGMRPPADFRDARREPIARLGELSRATRGAGLGPRFPIDFRRAGFGSASSPTDHRSGG
jgi:hypothetical protein